MCKGAGNSPAVLQSRCSHAAHNVGPRLPLQLGECEALQLGVVADQSAHVDDKCIEVPIVMDYSCPVVNVWLQSGCVIGQRRQHPNLWLWTILEQPQSWCQRANRQVAARREPVGRAACEGLKKVAIDVAHVWQQTAASRLNAARTGSIAKHAHAERTCVCNRSLKGSVRDAACAREGRECWSLEVRRQLKAIAR